MYLNPLKGIVGALMFIVGMLVFVIIWTPLVSMIPAFLCTETMAMTTEMWGIILLIPAVVVFTGLILIVSAIFEPSQPRF